MAYDLTDESTEEEFLGTEVTTSHYIPKSARKKCQNRSCRTLFVRPGLHRPHHCRRCGEIFCRACLQYKRRLNTMAQPDPNGILCKVCLSCFEDRVLSLGCTLRSHTELFRQLRKQTKVEERDIVCEFAVESRRVSVQPTFWREQFKLDIVKECQRLLEGFKASTSGSGTINTLLEIKDHVNVPNWQKSTFWTLESHTSRCRHCGGKLGHRKKMRNCRVCGLALCKACTNQELLLYFEDGTRNLKSADAHISIIRYSGCPEKEPQCSVLLYCCKDCKEEIIRRQIEDDTWYLKKSKPPDIDTEIIEIDAKFRPLVENIRTDMEKLSQVLDDLDGIQVSDKTDATSEAQQKLQKLSMNETDIEVLKGRVQEYMNTYWTLYSELRAIIKRHSDTLVSNMFDFVMNYATARKEFYIETEAKVMKLTREEQDSPILIKRRASTM